MKNEPVTLPQLAEIFARQIGCSKEVAETFIAEFFSLCKESLGESHEVNIKDFGRFFVRNGNVGFVPSIAMATNVNEPFAFFEPVELSEGVTPESLESEPDSPSDSATSPSVPEPLPASPATATEDDAPQSTIVPSTHEPSDEESYSPLEETPTEATPDDEPTYPADEVTDEGVEAEIVYETRQWPIVIGVIAGLAVGFIIGFFVRGQISPEATPDATDVAVPAAEIVVAEEQTPVVDSIGLPAPDTTATVDKAPPSDPTPPKAEIYDTVTPTRFLATMARQYYGVMEYWVFIYEENKDTLPANPNRIKPGTRVKIPPLEKYVPSGDKKAGKAEAARRIAEIESRLNK